MIGAEILAEAMSCVHVIDTERERELQIGENYDYPAIGRDECYISKEIAQLVDAKKGDYLSILVS